SIAEDREYGGKAYRLADGRFTYGKAVTGTANRIPYRKLKNAQPAGLKRPSAYWHTHGDDNPTDIYGLSTEVLDFADQERVPVLVGETDWRFWMYRPGVDPRGFGGGLFGPLGVRVRWDDDDCQRCD
ncbi:MAG: DUF4329 domain-containing protein, partial [Myxococcota bacterium]